LDVLGAKNAAEARRRFIKNVFECTSAAMFFECKSGGESRDAAANDRDSNHERGLRERGLRASPCGLPDAGFVDEYSWTKCARFFTFSTGVSGRMRGRD